MQINWFTVIAQVINFFLLVWLLKRFLYKPILDAIDEREDKIASQLNEAEAKKAEAKKEQADYKEKNQKFDLEKQEQMDKVIVAVKTEREKLMKELRNDVRVMHDKLEKEYIEIQENKEHELALKTQQEVFAISRKALHDLSSVSLEEQTIRIFIQRLYALSDVEKKQFSVAFKEGLKPVLVHSAFDLQEEQQAQIKDAVSNMMGVESKVQFSVTPELINGIELSANGFKVAWNIDAYLTAIEKSLVAATSEKPDKETEKI